MSNYYLKYYAELQNYRGQRARVEILQRDTQPASVLQIGDVCGLVLEIQGGQDDVFAPIVKTQARLSVISCDDKNVVDGVKYGSWGEFYTPDSTLYKMVIKTQLVGASSWTTRWTGYVTPDSWQEGLEYRSELTITARDNIGHLQDFEFDMDGADQYGLLSIRSILSAAMTKVSMPMDYVTTSAPRAIKGDGVSVLDSMVLASKLEGKDWYSVIEDLLDSIGYCLRYTDNNRITLAPLRYLPLLGEEAESDQRQMASLEFYNGDGEVVPAVKKITEKHSYDYTGEIALPIKGELTYGTTSYYDVRVPVNERGWLPISGSAPSRKLSSAPNTIWVANSDLWNPGSPSIAITELEGNNWNDFIFLAANANANSDDASNKRAQTLSIVTGTADSTLRFNFHRSPVTVFTGTDDQSLDGVFPLFCAGLYSIKYKVKFQSGSLIRWWDGSAWTETETECSESYDPIAVTTNVEIPLGPCSDIPGVGTLTFTFTDIQYQLTSGALPTWIMTGCYARLSSASIESNVVNLKKNTVTTINDEKNNVLISRDPFVAPLSRTVTFARPGNYESALFYYESGASFPSQFPYGVNWQNIASITKPLPVLIHQQLLCYRGATLWQLSGDCAPSGGGLLYFDTICSYKNRRYLIQSGVLDFTSGILSGAVLREFLEYDDIWDDTQSGDWEDSSEFNTIGGSTDSGSGSSGSSGSSGGHSGSSTGSTHSHKNKEDLDRLSVEDGYLMVDGEKATVGEADHATDADHADEADHAADSDKWEGHDFDDYLDQPVRTTDDVQFADVDADEVVASEQVVTPNIHSADFSAGFLGAGFRLYKPAGGNAQLELDELTVRKTMKVFELIIQQIKHQGGMVIYSAASLVCSAVEELSDGYKCYFDTEDDGLGHAQVPNEFVVGDQARCQRFDLANTNAKYYWRLVTAVGDDYIILSKSDCDAGSGVPAVGDNIVQLGNRTNTARQSAKVTTCIDSQSPRDDYYKGINSYDLTGKLITTVGVKDNEVGIWTSNGSFTGTVQISGGSGLQNLDEWSDLSQSIVNAQTAADKALAAIADINDDTVLDPSEKNAIRTEWITINGVEALDRVGARGSYALTKALFAQYQSIGGQLKYTYDGIVPTYNGLALTYSAVGVSALDAAYMALREYLTQVQLNNRTDSFDGFDRAHYSDLLTDYYNAEIRVNDQINQALDKSIKDTKTELLQDLGQFETAVESALEEMQGIIDNTIETWFYDGAPTLANLPASNWTTEELKARHLGDLYYNQSTGVAYRFQRSGSEGNYTYYWYTIPDSAVAEALAAAAAAQDTADHKRRVFTAQPTNDDAYDVGDLWLHATYGTDYSNEMLVCQTAKAAGVAFSIAHWTTATKYTDDTVANQAAQAAADAQSTADQAVRNAATAQQTADNAAASASAANTRLGNWANDGKISPPEKTSLKQQQKDIQTEYTEIIADATRYGVTTTAYAAAYTSANTALTKYTAASPEDITIESDYANIAAYYDARNTILQAIAAAAKKVADDAQDAADAAQSAADAAQRAADAAQQAADDAQDAADAAQAKADSAYSIATTARDRLANWASDNYISPQEKTSLKQQQSDIQAEYEDIVADANRYGVDSSNYQGAYTSANTALTKYTAATPENIAVTSDYDAIAAYYDARTTILGQISIAAKKVAVDAQNSADAALAAIADINSDSVLDLSEKAAIRTIWIGINGVVSLTEVGAAGTYAAAKRMIRELKETEMATKLTYGSYVYTYNGNVLTFGNYGESQLDAAYQALREFLRQCELFIEEPFYSFSRSDYAAKVRDYDAALVNVQRLYTDNAKQTAQETSLDTIAKNLGYTSFDEMVEAAQGGETIIDGGYIRSELINVTTLIAKRLATTDDNSNKSLTIQDNQIKLYDADGALRAHIHANALSAPSTNTQETFNIGMVSFTSPSMVNEAVSGSTSLFDCVASSGNDTLRASAEIAVNFNLVFEISPPSFAEFEIDIIARLRINGVAWKTASGGASVIGEGSLVELTQTLYLDPTAAKALSSSGSKNISVDFEVWPHHGLASRVRGVSGSVYFTGATYTLTHVTSTPQITEVGTDGIQVVRSGSEYAQLHESNGGLEFKIITGSYGLRVNSSGVQKTTNGGSSWTSI